MSRAHVDRHGNAAFDLEAHADRLYQDGEYLQAAELRGEALALLRMDVAAAEARIAELEAALRPFGAPGVSVERSDLLYVWRDDAEATLDAARKALGIEDEE